MTTDRKTTTATVEVHRVVVTGYGAVSPAGVGVDTLWEHVRNGEHCLGEITRLPADECGIHVAGEIDGYDPEKYFERKEARRLDRFSQYAMVAADEAVAHSGIDFESEDMTRVSVVIGSGVGGLETLEAEHVKMIEKGPRRVSPLLIPTMISNMAAGNVAIRFGARGACTNVVTACATGSHCIGEAFRMIRYGYTDVVLAGGTEAPITMLAVSGFANLGALSKAEDPSLASLPFDARRNGFVPGEGAGVLIVESLEHALARGAKIYGEIVGYGSTGDAYHITAPAPGGEGSLRAMRDALTEAGYTADEVDHINAHGTATHMNDAVETQAIKGLLGDRVKDVPVTSIKGVTGHLLGAAGAVEAIVTLKTLAEQIVPPTAGYLEPDPECDVRVSAQAVTGESIRLALSNSLGFGGHNAALAIAGWDSELCDNTVEVARRAEGDR